MKTRRESDLLRACLQYLQCLENNKTIRYVDRLNSGSIFIPNQGRKGGRRIRLCRAGTPDIMVVLNDGGMVWVECKSDTGTQEDTQGEFERMISQVPGHYYLIIRTSDMLEEFIQKMRG